RRGPHRRLLLALRARRGQAPRRPGVRHRRPVPVALRPRAAAVLRRPVRRAARRGQRAARPPGAAPGPDRPARPALHHPEHRPEAARAARPRPDPPAAGALARRAHPRPRRARQPGRGGVRGAAAGRGQGGDRHHPPPGGGGAALGPLRAAAPGPARPRGHARRAARGHRLRQPGRDVPDAGPRRPRAARPRGGAMNGVRWLPLVRKELRETLRDRRTILTLVLMPLLLYPLLSLAFRQLLLTSSAATPETFEYQLGFRNRQEAELITAFLRQGEEELERDRPAALGLAR